MGWATLSRPDGNVEYWTEDEVEEVEEGWRRRHNLRVREKTMGLKGCVGD